MREIDYKKIMKSNPPIPKRIMLEVSSLCNHRCIFCSTQKSQRNKMIIDDNIARRVIDEAYHIGVREISFHAMGEPLICDKLADYVKKAKDLGYEYVYIDTNGALATHDVINPVIEAGLDSIKFSISAANREDFKKVQGRDDFDKVIQNLINLSKYRKTNDLKFKLFVGFVETKYTVGQCEQLENIIGDYVDEIWFSGFGTQAGNMVDESKDLGVTAAPCFLCTEPFDRIVITSEGLISACCMDNDNNLIYGDVKVDTLEDAWISKSARDIRESHLNGKGLNKFCANCDLYTWHDREKYENL